MQTKLTNPKDLTTDSYPPFASFYSTSETAITPDEYLKLQETNKKIYELARNEEEKSMFLARMVETEKKYIRKNIDSVQIDKTIIDQPISFSMSPRTKDKPDALDTKDTQIRSVICEKTTPENFFDRVKGVQLSNGKAVDLRLLFKDNPKMVQSLCDSFNAARKAHLQKQYGNQADLQMFEDEKYIGFKQIPERIKSPDAEVAHIMNRAHNIAASKHQNRQETVTSELEEDLSTRAALA